MRKFKRDRSRSGHLRVLDKAKPGFVSKLMEYGYREAPVPQVQAVESAIQAIRSEHALNGDALEERFHKAVDAFEAERLAGLLIVLNSDRAVSVFEKALLSDSEPLRKIAARGLSEVVRTTEFDEDREYALDVVQRAANRGVQEVVREIEENLMDCGFREKMNLKEVLGIVAGVSLLLLNSRLVPVGAAAGSAFAFMNGEMSAGAVLGAAGLGSHLAQKYLFRSV